MEGLFEKFKNTKNIEIEIRFGTFGASFIPSIRKDQFDRMFIFLLKNNKFFTHVGVEETIDYYEKNIRKITRGKTTSFEKKTKIQTLDEKEWGFRMSISKEEEAKPPSSQITRTVKRTRHSFTNLSSKIRYDLDVVKSTDGYMFSIELECLENCTYQTILENITNTLKILQDSFQPISNSTINEVLKKYKDIIKKSKFGGIQPKTLSSDKFEKKQKYAITKKLDGQRYNLISLKDQLYSISSKMDVNLIPYKCECKDIIFDVEYYKNYYHIFDIVGGTGNLKKRVEDILKLIPKIEPYPGAPKIVLKEYIFTRDIKDLYSKFKNTQSNLDSNVYDGIILVKQDENYWNSDPLKWKPVYMNTVDFQILKKGNNTFELFVGNIVDKVYTLTKFGETTVTDEEYAKYSDGNIVEFSYIKDSWKPLKIRNDKDKPNFISIAEDNFNSVLHPFNPEETFNDDTTFFNMRRYHNFIKRYFINKYKGKTVLDLASGKGGDLGKYVDSGFIRIDGYDIDKDSVRESLSRSLKISSKSGTNVTINLAEKDLKKDVVTSDIKFDLVVTNFAFHYFYKNLDVYIKSVKNNIKTGGKLLLTLFDGSLLKNDIISKNFEIRKKGTSKVEVYLKDSVLNKPTVEYIVDIEKVINLFKENGLELIERKKFEDMLSMWKKSSPKNSLSDEEKLLSFLNVALVFIAV